jgi:hypothetical protein
MRAGLAVLALLAACGGGSSAPVRVVAFVDVAAAVGLDFTVTVGDTFPGAVIQNQQWMQRNMGNGAAVGDYDGDGDLDVYLLGHTGQANRLFRNNLDTGTATFTDATPAALADDGLSRTAAFVDLDNDGDLDLVLVNDDDGSDVYSPSRLFRNDGGGAWTDMTAGSGFRPIGFLRCGLAVADFDKDGRLDLLVTNWGYDLGNGTPEFPGANTLYRQTAAPFVFEDVTAAQGVGFARDSFSAIFSDLNGNGWPDLYVAVDHSFDKFYVNESGVFAEDFTNDAGLTAHTGNDMGIAAADFDDDDDLDFFLTNITDSTLGTGTTQGNVLYVNRGNGVFDEEAAARGVFDTAWGWGTQWVDAENDGDLDLVAVTGFDEWVLNVRGALSPVYQTPSFLLLNNGAGSFTRRTGTGLDSADDSRALVAFDYDRDGDVDLLVTNIAQPVRLFENRAENPGHWLTVAVTPDALGLGAVVRATVGGRTMRRDVLAGRSYLAGTPAEAHFGLGEATMVDTLRVTWADGTETAMQNVAADRVITVEPD